MQKTVAPRLLALGLLAGLCAATVARSSEVVYNSRGFEDYTKSSTPRGWVPFHAESRPDVSVVAGGAFGSRLALRGVRSRSGGWTALSRSIDPSRGRVQIEFSFAFAHSKGRTLNVWTHEPDGKDASQLNLCIQDGALRQYDGRTRTWEVITRDVVPTRDPVKPVWHRLRAIVDANSNGVDFWVSQAHSRDLPARPITRHAYRTGLEVGAIDFVSGTRLASGGWYLVDDLVIKAGRDLPAPHAVEPLAGEFTLWTGPKIPSDVSDIPFVSGVEHRTIHRASKDGYKFLHGAAIVAHKGTLYANWANSPTNENGPHETLQGRHSTDGGKTWSKLEVIAPGFDTKERHSHGVLFEHKGELWTICSRFGVGAPGRRFPGLSAEAFVLNKTTNGWESRGKVIENCWPYDEPVAMSNGSYVTGGQDKDGLPIVAISRGADFTTWDSIPIPYDPRLKPSFAETTVWAEGNRVLAVIRGGGNVAWVSTSDDFGKTWTTAAPSNFPMPRAKAYLGRLSTGQLYLVSNLRNRDTLVVSVSKPGESTLSKMWRVRHGRSVPPRFPGRAKSKQWSYPYGHEHDGKLLIVYSVGKEDCDLSVLPIESLRHD